MTISLRTGLISKLLKIARLAVGGLLLVIAVIGVDWSSIFNQFSTLDPFYLLLTIGLVITGLGLKIFRWQILLRLTGISMPNHSAVLAFFLGQAANIIMPFRGGEAVRLGVLAKQSQNHIPEGIGSILLEKYFDLIALTTSILILLAMISGQIAGLDATRIVLMTGIATFCLIGFLWLGPRLWLWISRLRFVSRMKGLVEWGNRLLGCLQWLKSPLEVLPVAIITVVIWLIMGLTNYVLFYSLGLPPDFRAALTVLVFIYLGVLPALMPGNFGPFYFFAQLALQFYNVPVNSALAYAIILHAIVTLPPLILGGVALLLSPKQKV